MHSRLSPRSVFFAALGVAVLTAGAWAQPAESAPAEPPALPAVPAVEAPAAVVPANAPVPEPSVAPADPTAAMAAEAKASRADAADRVEPGPELERDTAREVEAEAASRREVSDRIAIGGDARLEKGEVANSVVAVGGDAISEGEARHTVVAVGGDVYANGPVGESVVAVFGDARVNGSVQDVVAVFGDIELGPEARVRGNVAPVFGAVRRADGAEGGNAPDRARLHLDLRWAKAYAKECLGQGRWLGFGPQLRWAWFVAGAILALYLVIALLFRRGVEHVLEILQTRPGGVIVSGVLALLLAPLLIVLLAISMVGIPAIPFIGLALLLAVVFGKVAVLAWIGSRLMRRAPAGLSRPAVAVLVGGIIVLALYAAPVAGFLVFGVLTLFGLGASVYTILLATQREGASAPSARVAEVRPPVLAGVPEAAPASGIEPPAASPGLSQADLASLPKAGFWIRIAALLIDVVLVALIGSLLSVIPFLGLNLPGTLVSLAIYGAVLWKLKGSTIGGIVCGLRIVRADGRPMDWTTACVRALSCFLSLAFVGLGFIWIAIDRDRQGWHDKVAGTLVLGRSRVSLV